MERELSGLAPLYGIPGTVGGSLAMNAGAWGSEVKERIESINVMNGSAKIQKLSKNDLRFDYRRLHLQEGTIILEGTFLMERQKKKEIQEEIALYEGKRRETQPLQFPSAGSIFKNPPGASAGKVIEEVGLKGRRIGGAQVSMIHGNFIINAGGATAGHVLELIDLIQEKVFQEKGLHLEPEVRVVGG
jgi:UDP-N-acetylmuramate dehydrogenase